MTEEAFQLWLDKLKEAWVSLDPDAAANLCTEDVMYYEDPLQPPHSGRDAVRKIWTDVPTSQKNVELTTTILMMHDSQAIAHWHATFTRVPSNIKAELDGIYSIILNSEGLCCEFHQWWNNK